MFTADIALYLRDIAQYPTPTEEDNQRWLVQGNVQRVIERNLRLVVTIAEKWQGRGLALEDLVQEGTFGLMRGVQLYDPTKGALSSYLGAFIKGYIRNALRQRYRVMGMPLYRVARVVRLRRLWSEQYPHKELASASLSQIAACLDISEDDARAVYADLIEIDHVDHVQSLMTPLTEGDQEMTLADVLEADSSSQPEQVMVQEADRQGIRQWLSLLLPFERFVIVKRFGLEEDEEPWTQEAVAQELHIGVRRIRSLEERAMLKLRRAAFLSQ